MRPPRREPPAHGDTHQNHGRLHARHAQDHSSQCRRQTSSNSSPPPSTHQLHSHLLPSIRQQRPVFAYDSRQLGLWTPRHGLPASQQCAPAPTWYCNDAKHDGLRRPHLPAAGTPAHARTAAGPTQSGVVQQLLTRRGGQ
jgi:hypothetical protein